MQQETKDQLALEREIAQTNALTGPAPTRRSFILNSTGAVDTLDENAMSGAQRQMFLPQSAGITSPDPRDIAQQQYDREDELISRAGSLPPQAPPETISEMAARMYPRTQGRGGLGLSSGGRGGRSGSGSGSSLGGY